MKSVFPFPYATIGASLPSRGAWIEMATGIYINGGKIVAPLAGSVD